MKFQQTANDKRKGSNKEYKNDRGAAKPIVAPLIKLLKLRAAGQFALTCQADTTLSKGLTWRTGHNTNTIKHWLDHCYHKLQKAINFIYLLDPF